MSDISLIIAQMQANLLVVGIVADQVVEVHRAQTKTRMEMERHERMIELLRAQHER